MVLEPKRLVLGLVTFQLPDAGFNAIAKGWTKADLDHLGFPEDLRFVFPVITCGSAAGLLAGLRSPFLGRLTAGALVAYFTAALGFHAHAKDDVLRYVPAAAMLGWSALVFLAYRREVG